MRIVIDTNVYISALVFNKYIQELLESILEQHTVLLSPFIRVELSGKLKTKFHISDEEISSMLSQLDEVTTLIEPLGNIPDVLLDKDETTFYSWLR